MLVRDSLFNAARGRAAALTGALSAVSTRAARTARRAGSRPRPRAGGAAAVVTAAVLWGTTGTAQAFAPAGAAPVSVGAARIVLGGLLLLALAARGGRLRPLATAGRRTWLMLALGACCVAGYQLCFFAGVARTGVATGTVVTIGSSPVFIGLLSKVPGVAPAGNRLGPRWLVSTAGAVAGCAVLVSGGTAAGVEPAGVALALLSGLGYATYAVCAARLIADGTDHRTVMGVIFGSGGLILAPVLLGTDTGWLLTGRGLAVVLHLSVFTTAVGYLMYARGLRGTPVATAGTLVLAEPAVATVLGVGLLGERLDGAAAAGLAAVGLSLLVLVRTGRPVRGERAERSGTH